LLERERALKKLPAVQAAAEDEMPFEQRAAVAENFQNVVLRHGAKHTQAVDFFTAFLRYSLLINPAFLLGFLSVD
jgi:hypothetical protein